MARTPPKSRGRCFWYWRGGLAKVRKAVLAGWLFQVTGVACRKLRQKRVGRLRRLLGLDFAEGHALCCRWMRRCGTRVAPKIDRALERLSSRRRNAVLLRGFLNYDSASAANILRTRERRVGEAFCGAE
jgi:DNA-directed RNA polymerase specialized sigma24 family protein